MDCKCECHLWDGLRPTVGLARWHRDAQGIEVFSACQKCVEDHWKTYRPEIRYGYDQSDVDEPIEEDPGSSIEFVNGRVDVLCGCGWGQLGCPRSELPVSCPVCGYNFNLEEE